MPFKSRILITMLLSVAASTAISIDMNELSKELVNPIGMDWKLNNYIEVGRKEGNASPENKTSTMWNLQPVMPVMLTSHPGLTLMNRPLLPIFLDNPIPVNNSVGQFDKIDNITGIGDFTFQTSLGKMPKTSFGSYMWGAGASLTFPTASHDELGTGKFSAGPAGMLVGFTKKCSFGIVLAHEWSFAGSHDRKDVSVSMVQPLYYLQLGGGWQIGDNPQWSINWNNANAEKHTMPIGLGLFKTLDIFGQPWRLGFTPRYYVRSSDYWGSSWAGSFTITKVIKSPIKM